MIANPGRRTLLVASVLFLLTLPAVTPRFYASDEVEYFAYIRSLWFDRDLSFDNEYRVFYDREVERLTATGGDPSSAYGGTFRHTFLETTTATGLRINFAPIGSSLLWAPFFIATDAGVRVGRVLGLTTAEADGYSQPYIAAVAYASALYGFLAIVLAAVAVRQVFNAAHWSAAVAAGLGTPLVFYMYVAPGFSHAGSAFAVAAFVVTWLRVRETWTWSGVMALGTLAALMGMVREQDLFIAIGPAVDYATSAVRSARQGTRPIAVSVAQAAAGVATVVVCFLPQALSYLTLYGRLGPESSVGQKMAWTSPYAPQVLASLTHGFLFWTPLAVPAVAGLVLASMGRAGRLEPARRTAWVAALCLLMVASQIYVSGSVASWQGGAFGQRRLVGLMVFLAIGLAGLAQSVQVSALRRGLAGLVVACVWWNLGLIAQFGTGLSPRWQLDLPRNLHHNLVTIPRALPDIAWRYAFDRPSFYRQRAATR